MRLMLRLLICLLLIGVSVEKMAWCGGCQTGFVSGVCTVTSDGSTPSCESADVASAITAVATGDIISVPAGSCSWSAGVTIPNSKKIVLHGAGIGNTIITATTGVTFINSGYSGSEIYGFYLKGPSACIGVVPQGVGWKVHHMKFESTTTGMKMTGVLPSGGSASVVLQGVIYDCEFSNARNVVHGSAAMLAEGDSQHAAWARAFDIGGQDAVYFEDNTFSVYGGASGNIMDANYSGAYVFRHNTVNGAIVEAHSVQGDNRATRKWEVYGNIIGNTNAALFIPFMLRGGTGVVLYNSITGNWTQTIIGLDNVRSQPDYKSTHTGSNGAASLEDSTPAWGSTNITGYTLKNKTDGSECVVATYTPTTAVCTLSGGTNNNWNTGDSYELYRVYSMGPCDGNATWDGNTDSYGYPCRDQIGRGYDAAQWDHNPVGAYDQPLLPAYSLGNKTAGGTAVNFSAWPGDYSDDVILENRDYYNYTAAFDGSVGVGCGTLASRPAACTPGVGYWATVQSCSDVTGMVGAHPSTPISGTLYKCTAPNTWTSYFTPYTYPHPLRSESVVTPIGVGVVGGGSMTQ